MLYLIGLGLNEKSISREGISAIENCEKIYLENYTVDFPYSKEKLKKEIGKKLILAEREFVESLEIIEEAKEKNVALLVYGSPLTATTHATILQEAKNQRVDFEIIHNASIFDAVAETGLQLYKFGKTASMPHFEADSYMEIIKQNQSIGAHTLVLVDIGMSLIQSLEKLEKDAEKNEISFEKIIVCAKMGNQNSKILYKEIENLKDEKIENPFCFVIPGKIHFTEKEFLEIFSNNN